MNELKEIGSRLRIYLKHKRIGINEMARMTNTGGSQIHNILNGKKYGIDKLVNIFTILPTLSVNWIIKGEGEMENDSNFKVSGDKKELKLSDIQTIITINDKLKNDMDKLHAKVEYQEMTIDAYKRSLEIASSSNDDLKKMVEFFRNLYEQGGEVKKRESA